MISNELMIDWFPEPTNAIIALPVPAIAVLVSMRLPLRLMLPVFRMILAIPDMVMFPDAVSVVAAAMTKVKVPDPSKVMLFRVCVPVIVSEFPKTILLLLVAKSNTPAV